jgi:hypothetical protein
MDDSGSRRKAPVTFLSSAFCLAPVQETKYRIRLNRRQSFKLDKTSPLNV